MLRFFGCGHPARDRNNQRIGRLRPEDRHRSRRQVPHPARRRRRIGQMGFRRPDRTLGRQLPIRNRVQQTGFQTLPLQRRIQHGQIHGRHHTNARRHLYVLCRVARSARKRRHAGHLRDSCRAERRLQRRLGRDGSRAGQGCGPGEERHRRDGAVPVPPQGSRAENTHSEERSGRKGLGDHAGIPAARHGAHDGRCRRPRCRADAHRRRQHADTAFRYPERCGRRGFRRHRADRTHR